MMRAWFAAVLVSMTATPTFAQDKLKLAIGQIDAWSNQVPTLGMHAGIFQKHGIALENFGTQGAGETIQAVISGSADIGIGVGTPGAMRAFAKGGPVRVLAAAYTGVDDIYWFVPVDSPIKGVTDITEKHSIAYSTNGSTSDSVLRALIANYNLKAQRAATGGPPATLTMTIRAGRCRLVGSAVWAKGAEQQDNPRRHARKRFALDAKSDCTGRNRQC